jgi:hypothetical protein
MKLQKDDQHIDYVQFNVVIPKDLREDFQKACDFRRISQRQQVIFLIQDFIDAINLERERL